VNVRKWKFLGWLLMVVLVAAWFLMRAHYLDLLGRSFSK